MNILNLKIKNYVFKASAESYAYFFSSKTVSPFSFRTILPLFEFVKSLATRFEQITSVHNQAISHSDI